MANKEEEKPKIMERVIVRKQYAPVKIGTDEYSNLANREIDEILGKEDIVKMIKAKIQQVRTYKLKRKCKRNEIRIR